MQGKTSSKLHLSADLTKGHNDLSGRGRETASTAWEFGQCFLDLAMQLLQAISCS